MDALKERLQLTRSVADPEYLKDLQMQLKNFTQSRTIKDAVNNSSSDILVELILQYIQSATSGLPGCENKLGKSLASFHKANILTKAESVQRTKFLQQAEMLTRKFQLGMATAAQLRSTIFNNQAMIHRLCGRPHAALRCLVAAAEVEVGNVSTTDQALTHLNLSAVLSSLDRHRDSLGHANIAIQLLSQSVQPKPTTSAQERATSLLTMAHYNAAVEREHLKHRASSLVSYRSALKMAKEQLPVNHPVIQSIASGIFDASTNSVESYKLPVPPSGSPRSPARYNSPRSDRVVLNHLGLSDCVTDQEDINAPYEGSPRSKTMKHSTRPSPKKHKKIKRYNSLEEEIVAKFKSATKHGGRTIHGFKIQSVEDIFIAIDEDGGGTIDFDEFKLGLERLSIYLSVHAIERLMKEMIADGGGGGGANNDEITFKGFMSVMNRKFETRAKLVHSHHIVSRNVVSAKKQKKRIMEQQRAALRKANPGVGGKTGAEPGAVPETMPETVLETVPETGSGGGRVDLNANLALVTDALHMLFMEFDTNSSGHITLDELKSMLTQLPQRTKQMRAGGQEEYTFDDTEAERLMNAFDVDGNGEIEETEFNDWIKKGLSKTKEQREEFASLSTLAKKMGFFLDSMEYLLQDLIAAKRV